MKFPAYLQPTKSLRRFGIRLPAAASAGLLIFTAFSCCLNFTAVRAAGNTRIFRPFRLDTTILVTTENRESRLNIRLEAGKSGSFILISRLESDSGRVREVRWMVNHPVFRCCVGDVDSDGQPEVCLGVVKRTRTDPVERRRLFVYTIRDGAIRPLWLGSRIGMQLHDFALRPGTAGTLIMTVEKERTRGLYAAGVWRWNVFGPDFIRYDRRRSSLSECLSNIR
jgi:hypothetical protein